MIKDREVCLFLTLKCNQHCKYCHRFLGIDEICTEDNIKIINKLADEGIKNITFTGGEPLLYPGILELVKYAKEKDMKIKVISNGQILAENQNMREIYNYLDSLTLSIDSIDNELNEKMGRGYNHYKNIKAVLNSLLEFDLKVNINTVVSKMNIGTLEPLGNFIKDYNINAWRIFKFIPLRETAKLNKDMFEISKVDFKVNKPLFTSFPNIQKIEFREDDDMESKYVLIMPNGNVVITENKEDVTVGNIMKNSLSDILEKRKSTNAPKKVVSKIRTLIAYNNELERNKIIDKISNLKFVDIVGVSDNGADAYNKIIDLKPEMVFANYNLKDMDGLELMQKSKSALDNEVPIFNFISKELPSQELVKLFNVDSNKINAIINENKKEDGIKNALEEFKKFKES